MAAIKGKITPLRDVVLVSKLESGQRVSAGGIVIPDDNGKEHGIRARWGQVWAVGPDVTDLKEGEWVLVKHGRWTYPVEVEGENGEITKVYRVEYPDACELVCDEFPLDIKPLN